MKIFLFVFQIIIIIDHRYKTETSYSMFFFFVIPNMLIILKLINQGRAKEKYSECIAPEPY